jgi:energy-coupling factor transporter ATP-binding protein EcfA2
VITRPHLPYPGLRAFTAAENILFFGREGCVDQMLETLAETRFLAVLGSSGSGKSSLVRTGLLNAVERGAILDAGSDWLIADFHPGMDPMRALAAALVPDHDPDQIEALESFLGTWPGALVEWAQFGNVRPGSAVLLLVDQFEELFRYGDYVGQQAAEAFIALLLHSAQNEEVPIYVVLTMRSEYLGNCALIPGLAERINQGLYLTPRMDRQSCREAIEGPANLFGFSIEPKLVNQILNDMASFAPFERGAGAGGAGTGAGATQLSRRADQLPLMQHLLNRLWTRAEAAGDGPVVLTYADYVAVGGLEGALASHGQAVIDGLAPDDRAAVPTVFRALVSGRDAASAVRRAVPFAELEQEAGPAARKVVEAFRARSCNFLRPEAHVPLAPDTLIDISHESLIRQWGLLSGWTKAEADDGATWQRLIDREARWQADQGGLLTGRDLAVMEQWWDNDPPTADWTQRHGSRFAEAETYLQKSRALAAEQEAAAELQVTQQKKREERERRGRFYRWGLVGVLAPSLTLLAFTFWQLSEITKEVERGRQASVQLRVQAGELEKRKSETQEAIRAQGEQLQKLKDAMGAADRDKVAAEEAAREASTLSASARQDLDNAKKAFADILEKDQEKSDYIIIATRTLDECRKTPSNPICRALRGDREPGSEPR